MDNKLLQRQIKRFLKGTDIPEQFLPLLKAVSDMYDHYEADRQLLERSLEISSNELNTAYSKLEEKTRQAEEFNKNITDSIRYAKRIQEAVLPSSSRMSILLGDHFVLYQPKDIVSGDFFYVHEKDGWVYLSTADCTGHGVPGAFMSLLSISYLNEALNTTQLNKPNEILDFVRKQIIDALRIRSTIATGKQNDSQGLTMQDGMDCVLCGFDFNSRRFMSAGANNPVWLIKNNGTFEELKADKFPVGKHDRENIPFSLNDIQLDAGDQIYTFTDGFADQFGGASGKKFKYRQLKELLCSIATKAMEEQKNVLETTINKWKEGYEQVDDILLVGVRV